MANTGTSSKTAYYLDGEAIREAFKTERSVRGTALKDIEAWTGIEMSRLSAFTTGYANLGSDGLITLSAWMDVDIRRFIKKRERKTPKHRDTYDQKQLRVAEGFLAKSGLKKEDGESAVDALIRVVGELKAAGIELEQD